MAADRSAPRRRRFDDAEWEPATATDHPAAHRTTTADETDPDEPDEPDWSTYRDARHGPSPVPDWVVTDPTAIDTDRGVIKTGKEAEVSLLERAVPGGPSCLLAVKRYRSAEHRLFHRDAGYLEGRRVRRSREMRAMATRTEFGRELISGQWATAEFSVLSQLWDLGAAVPYPVQQIGTELMMEFIGSADGVAAPRLAETRPDPGQARELYRQLAQQMCLLAAEGYAHGDLSPYNVLVHDEHIVLIDLPQTVDVVGNPQGFEFLRRDCANIANWFTARGVAHADGDQLFQMVRAELPG